MPISIIAGITFGMVLLGLLDALYFHGFFRTGFMFSGAVVGGIAGFFIGALLGDILEGDDAW